MLTISEILLYMWVVAISTGFVFNLFGEKVILLLLILLTVARRKIKPNYTLTISIIAFIVFFSFKIVGENLDRSSDYFGPWREVVRIITLIIALICLNSLLKEKWLFKRNVLFRCIRLFNIFFYSTLFITILSLLKNGRGYYRNGSIEISPICAPQYFLIYSIVLGYILTCRVLSRNKGRLISIAKLITIVIFVLLMNYSTQMIFFLLAIAIASIESIGNNRQKKMLIIVILITAFVTIIPNLSGILMFLNEAYFSENLDVSMRLIELSQFFSNRDLSGKALGGRITIMLKSIESFQQYPLFGIPFAQYNRTTIGGHHEWADDLARYGLIGTTLFMLMVFSGLKELTYKNNIKKQKPVSILILFFIYGFFNPIVNFSTIISLILVYVGMIRLSSFERLRELDKVMINSGNIYSSIG